MPGSRHRNAIIIAIGCVLAALGAALGIMFFVLHTEHGE